MKENKFLGFNKDSNEKFVLNNNIKNINITFSKKRKRGRPSNKDKEIYDKPHNVMLSENSSIKDIASAIQKKVDEIGLDVKCIVA